MPKQPVVSSGKLNIFREDGDLLISGIDCLDLRSTLDCGQAFRFTENPDGSWQGIAHRRLLKLSLNEDTLRLYGVGEAEFESLWRVYLDLDRDYSRIIRTLSANETLKMAAEFSRGVRVLRQDAWETLCSFIISQNNHIARIKGIITRLCGDFGDPVPGGFSFPEPERLASCSPEQLAGLRAGFRAAYIIDAAQKVAGGDINLGALPDMPYGDAQAELMKIRGVGPKVADCTLLFGCGRIESFPQDVWIKRAMKQLFDGCLPECAVPCAGIAQQYLFYFARQTKLVI